MRKRYMTKWILYVSVIFALWSTNAHAQLQHKTQLIDPHHSMDKIWKKLDALRRCEETTLTIVHLGDSHIQAGYLSGEVMRRFHRGFGNAGRGLILPLKLSHSNEPFDYYISSHLRNWTSAKSTQHHKKTKIGPGGIGLMTKSKPINFNLCVTPIHGAGYEFDKVLMYRDQNALPLVATGRSKGNVITKHALSIEAEDMKVDTFYFDKPSDTLQLINVARGKPNFKGNIYYGFSLQKGDRGVLYHSVGVNGAMFINYTDEDFIRRLSELKPDLLIVSMGTNESFGRRFSEHDFGWQANTFLDLVKRYLPQTTIMLTTPPECYKRIHRRYVRNENTERVAKTLVNIAHKRGIACFDLFAATGGKGSSLWWYENHLMARRRIHFTVEGYTKQADLLFEAMMNSYKFRSKEDGLLH